VNVIRLFGRSACARGLSRGRRAISVAATMAIAGASAAVAQDSNQRARVDLPRGDSAALQLGALYELVTASSPRLEAARALSRAAEARVPGVRRPPDPRLQLGLMNRSLPSFAPMYPLGMTQLQLTQMVPVAGKLSLAGSAASSQALAARDRAEDVRWDVRSRVAMAFYDLYQTDRAAAVAVDTRRLLEDVASTAQSMYAVGSGRQADVLTARVEIAKMTEDIVRMRTMRLAQTAILAGLLDLVPDSTLASPELPAFPVTLPSLDSLLALADQSRPMIRAGRSDVSAADATARLARREIWPDLEVGVAYAQQGSPMGTERMGSLMIGASLPVFAGSRQQKMREEAEAMRAMTLADLAAMRAQTRARVTEVYANLVRARNLSALYRNTVLPQARAAVTSSLAAYRVGEVNLMTLLENQMSVNRYRQELFALDAEQGTTLAELEMLVGHELFDVRAGRAVAGGREP
jgi:outer membrane protein, heavy metal efflux system